MEVFIQLLIILAVFGVAIWDSVRKEKQKVLEKTQKEKQQSGGSESMDWFDDLLMESSKEKEKILSSSSDSKSEEVAHLSYDPKNCLSVMENTTSEEDVIEIETLIDITSVEEARKGMIWSEVLKRKYF